MYVGVCSNKSGCYCQLCNVNILVMQVYNITTDDANGNHGSNGY